MLVVVFQHIRAFGFNLMADDGVLSMVYLTFMLPAFFLVSGFASYRTDSKNSRFATLPSRFRQLVVPTVVFLLIHNLLDYDRWGFPGGYWFTYALFFIIVLNCVVQKLFSTRGYVPAMIVLSIIFFCIRGYLGERLDSGWPHYFCLRAVLTYFQYYALGVILRKYYGLAIRLMGKDAFRNTVIIAVATGFLFSEKLSEMLPGMLYVVFNNALCFIATFAIFMVFYQFRSAFEQQNIFAKSLNYVGRRTLDLYMLHYFFIPSLAVFGLWFKSTGNCCIELGVVGLLTVIVTIMSLTLSKILKISPFVNYWLFGGRKQKNISHS